MQIRSYTFQTPYPQQVQIGRPDPLSTKQVSGAEESAVTENQKKVPAESTVSPTLGGGAAINLTALSGSAQATASDFKTLSTVNQAQKAYVGASTS